MIHFQSKAAAAKRPSSPLWLSVVLLATIALCASTAAAATNEECLECHGEEGLEREEGGTPGDLHVEPRLFAESVHGALTCNDCHPEAVLVDHEHAADLPPASCSRCHNDSAATYNEGLHGEAAAGGDELAPQCWDCHSQHAVFPPSDPRSATYKFNVPRTCSICHQEGTRVAQRRTISQHDIIKNYSMSIHSIGLFQRGLTVTAVCTDCHGAHLILPHENPQSKINREQIAPTCMKCHGEIERVHKKVIKGTLWEKKPHAIPVCVDCHPPHEIRRVAYEGEITDTVCLKCHGADAELAARDSAGRELRIDPSTLHDSAHRELRCVKCHSGSTTLDDPPCLHSGQVDCSACHVEQGDQYVGSVHGTLLAAGNAVAPECKTCHGTHAVTRKKEPTSPINPANVPELCAKCHREGQRAAKLYHGPEHEIVAHYQMSVHGRGLIESGLLVTAMCTSCHTAHGELPASNPESTVHPDNIPATCGNCHAGVYQEFQNSIHSPTVSDTDKRLPSCKDCHASHTIARIDEVGFRQQITDQCGECHEQVTATYFDTYHGKVSLLGSGKTAKCSDCHGSHQILPPHDPDSTLSRDNIVETCGECHPGSHRKFAGYLTHATHHDAEKYPALYYSFWVMTWLLIATFSFFGLHTLMWLPRSFRELIKHKNGDKKKPEERWIKRFPAYHRVTHILVIISFFTLTITGMTLKFSYTEWAKIAASILGGFESAGVLHRIAALVTFGYFAMHLWALRRERKRQHKGWLKFIFDKEGLFPRINDVKEMLQTVRWFFGRGPRPDYGRWTYWEKFDYFAVFWGVAIIGITGLVLWFPEAFTYILPGQAINVATIIHSDEALLASGFIFCIHFFNTHFRPEKFPLDPVIFTGRVRFDEFKYERPREYRQLVESGRLEQSFVEGPTKRTVKIVTFFGLSALILGLALIGLIVYSVFFVYR
jgi:cytochrome b subunit of formate dehydrogenase